MSTSGNIFQWRERSKIDYFPLFISLWLAFNAWMKDRCSGNSDREMLNSLKKEGYKLSAEFTHLLYAENSDGVRFRGNLAELHRALDNARIPYKNWPDKAITFESYYAGKANGLPTFGSVIKQRRQHNQIKLDDEIGVTDEIDLLFGVYVDIVYEIRCALFHGDLEPSDENERVIRQLYITLSMLMENL